MEPKEITISRNTTCDKSLLNKVFVNPDEFPSGVTYIRFIPQHGLSPKDYILSIKRDSSVVLGSVRVGLNTRKWASLSIGQKVLVVPHKYDLEKHCIKSITLEVDYYSKKNKFKVDLTCHELTREFLSKYSGLSVTEGQLLYFKWQEEHLLTLTVMELDTFNLTQAPDGAESSGVLLPNSAVVWVKPDRSQVQLGDSD